MHFCAVLVASLPFAVSAVDRASSSPSCLDQDGKAIDYWYAMKYPNGWDYAFMAKGKTLAKAKVTMDDEKSAVSRTLQQLYAGHASLSFAMWNDEHADGTKVPGPHAHAKGVLAISKSGEGFWLTHSIPKFPQATTSSLSRSYDLASDKYGQSMICITINAATLKTVGALFDFNWPSVYQSQDNAKAGEDFTNWAVDMSHCKDCDHTMLTVKSKGGQSFTAFAKSGYWQHDLYDEVVAPHFKASFYSETWQNGVGFQKSYCKGSYHVENVQTIKMLGEDWTESQDHSKYLVSTTGSVLCVGDLNRQDGQRSRGGGTICISSSTFGKTLLKDVDEVETCKGTDYVLV